MPRAKARTGSPSGPTGIGSETALQRLREGTHLTPTGASVTALVVAGWFAAHALDARAMFLTVYGAVLMMILAGLASRRRLAVDIDRSGLPPRISEGQPVDVGLRVAGRQRVSTVLLEERLPTRLGSPIRLPLAALRLGEEVTFRYTLVPSLRGVYAVGPLLASWSDPLGLTAHSRVLAEPEEIIVHPTVEPVSDFVLTRMWEDPPIRPPVSKPWPVGFEFYGVRDYVPGDDLRRIVWPVVARTGKLMVRESEQGITDRVVVYIDVEQESHSPGDPSETFEGAVRAAAALGVRHLHDGFTVTLLVNGGRVRGALRGRDARMAYLDELARLQPRRVDGTAGVHALVEEARAGAHFLVITPHLSLETASQLRLVIERGLSVVLVHLVWDETDVVSLNRAASLGCRIVELGRGAALDAVFGGGRVGARR